MISFQRKKSGSIRRYQILGGRRVSNYWWSLVIFLGGCGFLIAGVSSYFNRNLWVLPAALEHLFSPFNIFLAPIGSFINKIREFFLHSVRSELFNSNPSASSASSAWSASQAQYPFGVRGTESMENSLPFFPQGLVLSFYGFLGLSFSFYLWFTLFWQVGGGFNEFNGKERSVRIFRWGRPGKNRRIDLKYTNELIEAIKIELLPRPVLFLRLKGEKNIPLTRIGEFIPLEELEAQAAELTSFLRIPLEMES